ncbi:MAG: hypothetical protein ACE5EG_02785 [Thermoanaerobaculia bacterium]
MTAESQGSLAQQVRVGENRELRLLAARGLVPVPLEELVTLQVYLAGLDEPEISSLAADSLRQLEPQAAVAVIADAPAEVVSFLAVNHPHPSVVERVLQRRDVPRELLCELAPGLDDELQEILLLRQDAIVERPEILDALESNEQLSSYAARRIAEYRQHLVPVAGGRRRRPATQEPGAEAELGAEVAAALAELEEAALDETEVDEAELAEMAEQLMQSDGFSEVAIRTLPTPVRMQLSRGAPRNLRQVLIRDNNPAVALSVLTNNAIPESELEQIASNRSVLEDVLEEIARSPRWIRKYRIARALVANPRTPVGLAIRLTARLSVRDLRTVSRDRNVPDAVRANARRLYRIKLK